MSAGVQNDPPRLGQALDAVEAQVRRIPNNGKRRRLLREIEAIRARAERLQEVARMREENARTLTLFDGRRYACTEDGVMRVDGGRRELVGVEHAEAAR